MPRQQPWARAIKRVLGNDSGYSGLILAPAAQAYQIDVYVPTGKQLVLIAAQLTAGTCTITITKNGVALTSFAALACSTTRATGSLSTDDGTQNFVPGDKIGITVSAVVGATELAFSLNCKAT